MQTVFTEQAPAAIGPYSQAKLVEPFLFTSGQIPVDPVTNLVVEGGIASQADMVMKNLAAVLAAADLSLSDVVKTTCFLADMEDFAVFNAVYQAHFQEHKPARSCVAVKTLPKNVLVEVEAIAVRSK